MGDLWYRAVRPEAFVGMPRAQLDPILVSAGAPSALFALLDQYTALEPLHVSRLDEGYNATNTPRILILDVCSCQIDAGINEIPQAVCEVAVGRDGISLADGASNAESVSLVHYLERYLGKYVPVRIYARATVTATEGAPDGEIGDFVPEPAEWVVLFDGLTVGPTRRGTAADYRLVLHLTHFTAALNFSSSLSGNIAAGTENPYALNTTTFVSPVNAPAGSGMFTPAGFVASALAGGSALETDFWGFDVPGTPSIPASGGLKRFLYTLASNDLFDWAAFATADTGGSFCPPAAGTPKRNDRALAALSRIEPFVRVGPSNPAAAWATIRATVAAQRDYNNSSQASYGRAVDRTNVVAGSGGAYGSVGYRYGVPISFYLDQAVLGPFNIKTGFAADIAAATFGQLAPASFWELLSQRYASRYQIAIAPMADRAVVVPFQPLLNGAWQTIYASEIADWNDDVRNPIPIRGVVLLSQRTGDAGFTPAGVLASAAAGASAVADAAYDSCEDGAFIYRAMPTWLVRAPRNPAIWAAKSTIGLRTSSSIPSITGAYARGVVDTIVRNTPGAAGLTGAAAYIALGLDQAAVTAPTVASVSTANRMAKALFQQTRTQPRTVFVGGRYRTDIGPGSIVNLELPSDRYVKAALVGQRDNQMTGMVLRMTISLDRERMNASTHFQIGFVRTEAEAVPSSTLYSQGHPYWSTACYGVPWADSLWLRDRLAGRADINFRFLVGV